MLSHLVYQVVLRISHLPQFTVDSLEKTLMLGGIGGKGGKGDDRE